MTRRAGVVAAVAAVLVVAAAVGVTLAGRGTDPPAVASWSAPTPVPIPPGAVGSARTTIDSGGVAHVLYTERRDGTWNLREVTKARGADWSPPRTLAASSPFAITPIAVTANSDGDTAAVWQYSTDRRGLLMVSTRVADGEWEPEQALSRVTASVTWPQVVVAADGTATVVGRGLAGPGLWAARREPGGRWQAPQRIIPPGLGVDAPAVTIAPDGRVGVVALEKRPGVVRSLFSVTSTVDGRWGSPSPIPGSDAARFPVAAVGRDGALVAGWTQEVGGVGRVQSAAMTATGSWGPVQTLDQVPAQRLGTLAVAGADGDRPVLAWSRWRGPATGRRAEVRATDQIGTRSPSRPVASLAFPPVAGPPRGVVVYGPPPVYLLAGTGPDALLVWGRPAATGSAIEVSVAGGAGWAPTHALSDGPRSSYPMTAGGGPDGDAVIWADGPPGSAADRLLISER